MFFKLNSKEPRTRKSVKKHGYFSFGKSLSNKYRKQFVAHKAAEVIGEFIGKKSLTKL